MNTTTLEQKKIDIWKKKKRVLFLEVELIAQSVREKLGGKKEKKKKKLKEIKSHKLGGEKSSKVKNQKHGNRVAENVDRDKCFACTWRTDSSNSNISNSSNNDDMVSSAKVGKECNGSERDIATGDEGDRIASSGRGASNARDDKRAKAGDSGETRADIPHSKLGREPAISVQADDRAGVSNARAARAGVEVAGGDAKEEYGEGAFGQEAERD
ncbi:hypothetical protein RFI_18655 [Reticulomyxa filosa]|uniref:Uncharacterized protein n=1 Tax=Reticulomyxa filosa TaxID=46433 RepID=X6MX59_RETFI|nr:hypothetical protein RFI_18655 [Reticulomyxa filosa]|eukprot:ETO18610.1 hypothetical protein RFI_18655 [Reticulomyxa filosa]